MEEGLQAQVAAIAEQFNGWSNAGVGPAKESDIQAHTDLCLKLKNIGGNFISHTSISRSIKGNRFAKEVKPLLQRFTETNSTTDMVVDLSRPPVWGILNRPIQSSGRNP